MNGYGNHSFRVINESGQANYIKFHIKSDVSRYYGLVTCTSAVEHFIPEKMRRIYINHVYVALKVNG